MTPVRPITLPPSFTAPSAPAQLGNAQALPVPERPDPSMTWGDAATVLSLLASVSTLLRS